MLSRTAAVAAAVTLVLVACGGGTDAPVVAAVDLVCADTFCVQHPVVWELVDQGSDFVTFRNRLDPEVLLASVGPVNMEGVVIANGGTWPQTVAGVVEVFWDAADGGDAELATLTVLPDGSVEAFGAFGGGRMWTRLIPIDTTHALGVELRAPNSSWEPHARVLLDSLTPVP